MNKPSVKQRNQTLECCRIIGAVFVVFLHVPFPGLFGELISCLSRFAVPMFFAISGWYSYRTEPKKLMKRAGRIWLLELAGICFVLVWKCVQGCSEGIRVADTLMWRIPDGEALIKWLVFQVDPVSGPLWYLSAAAVCYLVLAAYVRLLGNNYRLLHALSGVLLACHFAMSEFSGFTGIRVEYIIYRNAWFFGIPMFTMGLMLRQLREGMDEKEKQAVLVPWLLFLTGIGLSLAEWRIFGGRDLHAGTVITVAGLMLLTAARPGVPHCLKGPAKSFGFLATAVYLIHLTVYEVYGYFFGWRLELSQWMVPLLVAAVSLLIAAAVYLVRSLWNRIKK